MYLLEAIDTPCNTTIILEATVSTVLVSCCFVFRSFGALWYLDGGGWSRYSNDVKWFSLWNALLVFLLKTLRPASRLKAAHKKDPFFLSLNCFFMVLNLAGSCPEVVLHLDLKRCFASWKAFSCREDLNCFCTSWSTFSWPELLYPWPDRLFHCLNLFFTAQIYFHSLKCSFDFWFFFRSLNCFSWPQLVLSQSEPFFVAFSWLKMFFRGLKIRANTRTHARTHARIPLVGYNIAVETLIAVPTPDRLLPV